MRLKGSFTNTIFVVQSDVEIGLSTLFPENGSTCKIKVKCILPMKVAQLVEISTNNIKFGAQIQPPRAQVENSEFLGDKLRLKTHS